MQRKYMLLAAVAFVIGAAVPMAVTASEYEELASEASGVHLVDAEDERVRIEAAQPVGLVVYDAEGTLLTARTLDAGASHDVVLEGTRALVSIVGGNATVKAAGNGTIQPVQTTTERVMLAESDGSSPVDTTLTLQLPDLLVGALAGVDGEAEALTVTASTGDEIVLQATGPQLEQRSAPAPVTALRADALDIHVNATRLNGTVWAELETPVLPPTDEIPSARAVQAAHDGETIDEPNRWNVSELSSVPMELTLERNATLEVALGGGHVFDASVYDEEARSVAHLHAGPSLGEAREGHCQDALDCRSWHHEDDELVPQTLTRELSPGTYLLYVRAGWAHGEVSVTDAEGEDPVEAVQELDLHVVERTSDGSFDLETPLLDVWGFDLQGDVQKEVSVSVDDEEVYRYRALASQHRRGMGVDLTYTPAQMEAGNVTVSISGAADQLGYGGERVHLLTVAP